jgi:hypothetical protein
MISPEIQELVNLLAVSILTVLVAFLSNLIRQVTPQIVYWIQTKFTADQLAIVKAIVEEVVQAVEQKYNTGQLGDYATAKKDYALQMIQDEFNKKGIPFDLAAADRMIEAAINQGKEQPMTVVAISEDTPVVVVDKDSL